MLQKYYCFWKIIKYKSDNKLNFIKSKNAKNLLIYNFSTWAPPIISFALLPLYTSYLSLEDYGVRALILLAIIIFDVISNLGLNWLIRAKYHKLEENKKVYLFSLLLLSIFFRFTIILLLLPVVDIYLSSLLNKWDESYIYIFYLQLIIYFMNSFIVVLTEVFVVERKAKEYSYIFIFSYLINITIATFYLVYLKEGIGSIFYGEIYQAIIFTLFSIFILRKHFCIGFTTNIFKDIIKIGLPALPKSSFAQIQQKADQYIMQMYLPIGVLGVYSKSQFIRSGIDGMNKSFSRAYSPSYMKDKNHNKDTEYTEKLTTKWLLVISVIYIFFVLYLLDIFILMRINPDFYIMATIAPMLALRSVIMSFGTMFSNNILISEKTYIFTIRSIIAGIVSVLLNLLLIPSLEIIGAIISSIISAFIIIGFGYYYSERKLLYKTYLNYKVYFFLIMYLFSVTFFIYFGTINTTIEKNIIFILSIFIGIFINNKYIKGV